MTLISDILAIIAPVIAIVGIGYLWERRGLPFDSTMVTPLVINLGSPCLLLNAMLTTKPDLTVMARISFAAVLVMALTAVAAYGVNRVMKLPQRAFLPVVVFGNTGNVGLPLSLFAFGPAGLALAVAYFATQSILQFSLGVSIASGKMSWSRLFTSPALIAIIAGCGLIAADVTLPRWVGNTIATLGNLTIPLMLLSLGTSLASLRVVELHRGVAFSLFRIVGGFALSLGAVWLLDLDGAARGAVIIQSSMPSAVFNYLFAAQYGNRPAEVAGIVFLSTVFSFLTLPLLMVFVLHA